MKFCNEEHLKIIENMYKDGRCKICIHLYYEKNKDKILKRNKKYRELHPEKIKKLHKTWSDNHKDNQKHFKLKRLYGISFEQYEKIRIEQEDLCKVCKMKCITGRDLAVDHGHITGKIRGLLCNKCNHVLGLVNDNALLLQELAVYLIQSN